MLRISFLIIVVFCVSLSTQAKKVKLTVLQVNDLYEMTPVTGNKYGGLARLQTLLNQLRKKSKTITILGGDLLSPSAIGAASIQGRNIGGTQMIDVLNHMDWDYMTIGNHEFDSGIDFKARVKQAEFTVFSSNVYQADGSRFNDVKDTITFKVDDITIGLVGIMLRYDEGKKNLSYKTTDQFEMASNRVNYLKENGADIVLAVTHQSLSDDIKLADLGLDIDLILGGHEHENMSIRRGPKFTHITKADANARSVFIHDISYDTNRKTVEIESKLEFITSKYKEDAKISALVSQWKKKAFDAYRAKGIEPNQVVTNSTESLNGLESAVRNNSTRLTEIIANSALHGFPNAELSILNGGSIRIDDVLPPGEISYYDILRILPFGGEYSEISIPGKSIISLLSEGEAKKGSGSYLQYANVAKVGEKWQIAGEAIIENKIYTAAIASYMLEKGGSGLFTLSNENAGIEKTTSQKIDARKALFKELQTTYGINQL